MKATNDPQSRRLAYLQKVLDTFPASVAAVSYAGDAPPLVRLGSLLTLSELAGDRVDDSVLLRFTQRLKKARPDLTLRELLQLPVPASAGDQEVYTARLGKWLFEKRMLERALEGENQH